MRPSSARPTTAGRVAETTRDRLAAFWNSSRDYYLQAASSNSEITPEKRVLFEYLEGGERILDLGSGSCENSQWLPPGCRYLGLDVSMTALRMADEAGHSGWRTRGDAARLPFRDRSLDAVLSTWVLEHLPEPGATFVEVARVLKRGGLLLLVGSSWDLPWEVPPSMGSVNRLGLTSRRLRRQLRSLSTTQHSFEMVREPRVLMEGYVPDSDAVYVVQSWQLARFLTAVGFEILRHRSLPHRPDPAGVRGSLRRSLRRVPLWRHGWGNTLIVARRGEDRQTPDYETLYL